MNQDDDGPLTAAQLLGITWPNFDRIVGMVRNALAAIGFAATVGFIMGFIWGYFK